MQLTHEHEQLRATVQRWIAGQVNPNVDQWERGAIVPAHQVFRQLGRLGLLRLNKPQDNGGRGLDYSYAAVLAETLGEMHCGGGPMAIGVQTDTSTPKLAERGSPELRDEFLAPVNGGEFVGCLGVSEVGSGSDVASVRTTARKVGGDYVINGGKMWTTSGTQADFCLVLANTCEGAVHWNKSLIVVPMKTPGVTVARKLRKMGVDASDTAQRHFDDVRVPQRHRIGEQGMGLVYQMEQFQIERLWGALNACGIARRAIRETIAYTRERKAFGRAKPGQPVGALQAGRGRCAARVVLGGRREGRVRPGRHTARDGREAEGRARRAPSGRRLSSILGRDGLHGRKHDLPHLPRHAARLHRRRCRRVDAADPVQVHGNPFESMTTQALP